MLLNVVQSVLLRSPADEPLAVAMSIAAEDRSVFVPVVTVTPEVVVVSEPCPEVI